MVTQAATLLCSALLSAQSTAVCVAIPNNWAKLYVPKGGKWKSCFLQVKKEKKNFTIMKVKISRVLRCAKSSLCWWPLIWKLHIFYVFGSCVSENSIVAFLFQSFEPLGILRSSHPSPIFLPQLNHDEYSKGSFKGSLVLILQNNEEGETMWSLVLWLCSGIKTSCLFHRCIE